MQPKDLLLYYSGIFLVVAFFILRRRPAKRMLLKLRGSGGTKRTEGRDEEASPKLRGRDYSALGQELRDASRVGSAPSERSLNIVFNYNGHSWDAYEVLGVPAGSGPERVEAAYRESLTKVDAPSKPFMDAAYSAIRRQN